jgi:hypothetical protein
MENTHNSKLTESISGVLNYMNNLNKEDVLDEIIKYLEKNNPEQKFGLGQKVVVDFALGSATVVIKNFFRSHDGNISYHVEDINTGHQDIVGQELIK